MKFPRTFRPAVESLGDRVQPSITLANGVVGVVGTPGADAVRVTSPAAGQIQVTLNTTGETRTFSLSQVVSLDIRCGGGNDFVSVKSDVTVDATVRGSNGDDFIVGGGGDDNLSGGRGRDGILGRGGNDDLSGDDGNDSCDGGDGDDRIDGGRGRDGCRGGNGDDDVSNGFDPDTELLAIFTGGQGEAKFEFGPDDGGIEREFEVEVEDLTPNATAGVFVDGVSVGTIRLNAVGDGRLEYELDFDGNDDGAVDFPPGFPEISAGSVVTVTLNGAVVRQGTFVETTGD